MITTICTCDKCGVSKKEHKVANAANCFVTVGGRPYLHFCSAICAMDYKNEHQETDGWCFFYPSFDAQIKMAFPAEYQSLTQVS